MYEAFGDAFSIATVIYEMGNLALIKGQHEQAAQLLVESLGMFREVGVKLSIARTLRTLAGLASSRSEWVRAVRLYAAAQRLFDELGYSVPSAEASEYERTLDALRVQLDWTSWEDAWHKGAAMSVDDIVEYGMQASPRKRRRSRGARVSARAGDKGATPAHLSLSARETQVLRLVAAGHSDPQVASHLSISPRTVEAHLRSIYSKLEVTNRREATRYAREHNLL
jgi:ATP/maltotriose-dependent transcriptional regulator MalT